MFSGCGRWSIAWAIFLLSLPPRLQLFHVIRIEFSALCLFLCLLLVLVSQIYVLKIHIFGRMALIMRSCSQHFSKFLFLLNCWFVMIRSMKGVFFFPLYFPLVFFHLILDPSPIWHAEMVLHAQDSRWSLFSLLPELVSYICDDWLLILQFR